MATLAPLPPARPAPRTNEAAAPVLEVQDLSAFYQLSHFGIEREVRAVDGISFAIGRNEIYGLAGESSSGKSSLIKTVAGAIRPPLNVVGGSVTFDFGGKKTSLYAKPRPDMSALRWKHLSYIMQGSMSVLNPVRRIRASFVDFAHRHIGGTTADFLQTVRAHLDRLHLPDSVLESYPHELSGGMRQRVTIALATVCQPEFVIADEPTTALDVVVQKSVLGMIREVQREMGSSMLFVTHDMSVHANLTDRLGVMYAGRLVEEGRTRDLFRRPMHPYTKHLIGSLPRIGATAPKKGLEGSPPNLANPPKGCRFHPRCPVARPVCSEVVPPLEVLAPGQRVACHVAKEEAGR
ncbi:ABC transporter ATP-binding protein [Marinivivus vitaminiproducens]|uniref:ABC transporter ATP-binding protein n=1 Tax=Marinivivus vitaminiproducens TaxID=3035935 RepID=UPI002799547E|nr:ABC transporter ATP-binding protein [Geminicoccaceae bacterium SCSIO 64248]